MGCFGDEGHGSISHSSQLQELRSQYRYRRRYAVDQQSLPLGLDFGDDDMIIKQRRTRSCVGRRWIIWLWLLMGLPC